MARIILTNGVIRKGILPLNGRNFTLPELKKHAGVPEDGIIQIITHEGKCLVMDEEGKLKELPKNDAATSLFWMILWQGDYIAGNAFLCDSNQIE